MPAKKEEEISLMITVRQPDGSPFPGAVEVEMRHQTLSDRRVVRNASASQPIAIAGLHRTPQGLYQITVTPKDHFSPESQFVNIPASGFASIEFALRPRKEDKPQVMILGENEAPRDEVEIGESLTAHIRGLTPTNAYEFEVSDGAGRLLFRTGVITNREGTLEPTGLWPQVGLNDPFSREGLTVEEAIQRWQGKQLRIELRDRDRLIAHRALPIAPSRRPVLVSTDVNGRLLNAVDAGQTDALVTALNLPFRGHARVYMVPSQQNWLAGNAFQPVRLASGREAFVDVEIGEDRRFVARLARGRELRPGAYDFIVRQIRYGYEEDEDFLLRSTDVVTRVVTGLVVRGDFMESKVVRGGCVNMLQIAGRSISGAPYFQYADTFQVGENVYGALDPLAIDPNLIGKMVALYVVPHKDVAQWSADPSLNHLAALGGNPNVQKLLVQSGCINMNKRLIWPAASQIGEYDVIADFGNNTADPTAFNPDDTLTPPTDIVDGYFVAGFRVAPDPTTDAQFTHAGSFEYNDGPITVTDDGGGSVTLDRKAVVYFPADFAGGTTPAQISGALANYPIVVAVHGNSGALTSYQGYNYLLEHWARNGFIAASVHLQPGMNGTGRARVLFAHLTALKSKFGAKASNNIGIMGHSRGGEAVAIAARLNQQEGLGHDINAVISLAPTDQHTFENLGGAWATPYLVVYGSMDGDVAGDTPAGSSGFRLYDRASGERKCMVFVYGSTHGRYNTVWGDTDITAGWSKLGPTDIPKLISPDAHQKVAKGYMTAFFRRHLRNETQWDGVFKGEWRPAAVEAADGGAVKLYIQYQDVAVQEIDHFEGPHTATSWQTSSIFGAVDDGNTLPVDPNENTMATLDSHTPHQTSGLLLRWDGASDRIRFDLPAGQRDISGFQAVSFRITQKYLSASNPAGIPQDLYLALRDGGGMSRAIRVSRLAEIPPPHERHYSIYTKSAMRTVRIPLAVYKIAVLGTVPIDLTNVENISFEFNANPTGEIEIDNVEFTN